jgi:periplasmic divalent cation tolerance protein
LLSAKTTAEKWLEISAFIQKAHPYDLPEILAFSPEQYEKQYGRWVQSEVNSKS